VTSSTDKTTFLYFAYGSNMLTHRLIERTPSAKAEGIGYVEGHRLAFDKVSSDGSSKVDIEATDNQTDRVYGVLFRIDRTEEGNSVSTNPSNDSPLEASVSCRVRLRVSRNRQRNFRSTAMLRAYRPIQ